MSLIQTFQLSYSSDLATFLNLPTLYFNTFTLFYYGQSNWIYGI